MISIAHKIELVPNNKQKTYFRKAFGVARLAYNWGIAEWQRRYKAGEKCSFIALNNAFNAIKGEQYPFVYEVTKYACSQSIKNVAKAYSKFFKDIKKGVVSYPKFKRKKDNAGSFYIGGDQIVLSNLNENSEAFKNIVYGNKRQYLRIPNLGYVKLMEDVRFEGHINGVTISQKGSKFYASFSIQITKDEYKRTHPRCHTPKKNLKAGVDLGIKSAVTLSDGVIINSPSYLKKHSRINKKLQRQLNKRVCAKTKQDSLLGIKKSKNYKKLSMKLSNENQKIVRIRYDFMHKVTTILTTHYANLALETLNVKGLRKNSHVPQLLSDVSFGEFFRQINYKSEMSGAVITKANLFYPSSKTCYKCGNIKSNLKLSDRIYHCEKCGVVINRDYNASLNLLGLIVNKQIGADYPESTPEDLAALLSRFDRNGIATSKVETGRQHEI